MSIGTTPAKDAQDTGVDASIDWRPYLGEEAITASEWRVEGADDALEIDSDTDLDNVTTVRYSLGTATREYVLTNTITLSGGGTRERSIIVPVKDL